MSDRLKEKIINILNKGTNHLPCNCNGCVWHWLNKKLELIDVGYGWAVYKIMGIEITSMFNEDDCFWEYC